MRCCIGRVACGSVSVSELSAYRAAFSELAVRAWNWAIGTLLGLVFLIGLRQPRGHSPLFVQVVKPQVLAPFTTPRLNVDAVF